MTTANFLQAVILGVCIFKADAASITVLLAVIHYLGIQAIFLDLTFSAYFVAIFKK